MLGLGLFSVAADAATEKEVTGFIGGARGLTAGGMFTEPSDVAIYEGDGTRKLFVAEAANGNARVQRLDDHGNFEIAWGRNVVRPGARGDGGGQYERCVVEVAGPSACRAGAVGDREGEFHKPTALDVNDATGDVYVMDIGNRRVQRFDFDGRFVDAWGWGVATGTPRSETCTTRCRAGVAGGQGSAAAGQVASAETGAIAVSPVAPHHVFVGDEGNDRVLEYTADGRFVAGWGWGVARGAGHRFERCGAASGCEAGRPRPGGAWPRHLAVDREGIVYASEALRDSGIVRFKPNARAGSGRPGALLAPLTTTDRLSGGFTIGLAVDQSNQSVVVARNPFGPMLVDEIGSHGGHRVQRGLTYLGSVNGLDAAGGSVFVAKSTKLNYWDPEVGFNGCGRRRCNGVVVLGPPGRLNGAVLSASASGGTLSVTGAVAARGFARYRVQASTDGLRWRDLAARYVSGRRFTRVATRADGLDAGRVYRFRIVASRRPGEVNLSSNSLMLLAPPADGR